MRALLTVAVARNFDSALRLIEAAVTDCPDRLWETDLWPDEATTNRLPHGGLHGSAPWFLGYHALTCLDYDLGPDFDRWAPPPPLDENTFALPNRVFTKDELLGYIEWCRRRTRQACELLSDEVARRPLPSNHRYAGTPYIENIAAIPLHVVEHAAQIRQFLTGSGVKVQPMPGDRNYTGSKPDLP